MIPNGRRGGGRERGREGGKLQVYSLCTSLIFPGRTAICNDKSIHKYINMHASVFTSDFDRSRIIDFSSLHLLIFFLISYTR